MVSTSASYSFTVTGGGTYVANFSQNSYTISASANPSAGGTVSGGGTYNYGSSCTLTATANTGYTFTNWTKNGTVVSTNTSYSFTVTGGGIYVANFSQNSYTISVSANPSAGGTVSGGGTYNYGSTCTLTATANTGYTFNNWTENGTIVSVAAIFSFEVTGNRTLVANFADANGTGTLSGVFSVGVNTHVNFSQGNLQYQASTNTWRFATNQYDCIGSDNSNISETYSGWIDLFGWGTSGYNHGAVCYQPWSVSGNIDDYYVYGNGSYNLYDQTGQADWGYNAISNGGDTENIWRTLTNDEWSYVLYTRTTSSGIRYAKAQVNGICGIILLPDDWSSSYYSLNNTNISDASYSTNEISSVTWASDLEANGAVFLPAAGQRDGTWVNNVGWSGKYWSASCNNNNGCVWYLSFTGISLYNSGNVVNRYYGSSVRLVTSAFYSFSINATSNPPEVGTVNGGGTYEEGTTCTLTATANAGYIFMNWTENGEVVSTEAAYSFTVTGDRDLVANFMQVLSSLSDDFNDSVIDTTLWTYQGSTVYEDEGLMKIEQNVTDNDVRLTTLPMVLTPSGQIMMERSFKVHRANNYFSGGFAINFNGIGDEASYIRIAYWHEAYAGKYGTYVDASIDGEVTEIKLCDAVFDTWLTEKVIVDKETGRLMYYLNNELVAVVPINGLASKEVLYYTIKFWPYGWWTGHYHYMDYVNINPLSEGLIAYYPFDGDANDYSGNEHHATPYNNYQYEDGLVGESIAVVGQGDSGSSGGHIMLPELDFGTSTSFTLNLWVKSLGLSISDGETYINFGVDVESDRLYIMQYPDHIGFVYHDASISIPYENSYTGNWMMYSLTLDENGTLKAYINGTLVGEESVTFNGINTSLAALGRHWWSSGYSTSTRFTGSFDEVRIYNRALSPEEVQMLYENNVIEITAMANPEEGGTVSGAGLYSHGDTCTLIATPNASYTFINWTENGETVSTETTYSFIVTGDRNLVANFIAIPPAPVIAEYYPDPNGLNGPYVKIHWASSTVPIEAQIGESTYITTSYFPFYTLFNYSIAENIFLASELEEAGVNTAPMTSLSWYATNVPGYEQQGISIWMANVSDTELTTTSHIVNDMTLVYTGTMTPEIGWNEFVFNVGNFAWDGTSNVLIFCQRNNGAWNSTVYWQAVNVGFNASSYRYQDSGPYDVSMVNTMSTSTLRSIIIMKCEVPLTCNIYRANCDGTNTQLIAENLSDTLFIDETWWQLENESYKYGVSIADSTNTDIFWSNCIDKPEGVEYFEITAIANSTYEGTVIGAGIYSEGQTCTLTATPNEGYSFIKWTKNGNVVSYVSPYSFTVTENADYVAHFEGTSGVIVGNPESTNQYLPSYSFYNYTLSQQIYTPDEIGTAGNLASISFFNTGSTKTRNYDIYMVHTDKTVFENNTDWITVSEADLVYSGDVTMTSGCWNTIVLDTPFAYNGISNLAIIVDDNSGNWSGNSMSGRVFNTNGNQAIRVYSDGTNYDPYNPSGYGGTLYSVKNQIILGFTITQTTNLSQGWNWFSTYVEITLDDLKAALVEALPGTDNITIKSKNDGAATYNGTVWRGQLGSLDLSRMYRVYVEAACEITLEGLPINPAEHPITLSNGFNWIAFPFSESKTLTEAFAGFAINGDAVKSKGNGAANYNGTSWRGTLNALVPGQGYIYKSNAMEDRVFTFPVSAK